MNGLVSEYCKQAAVSVPTASALAIYIHIDKAN
jgi:hypothetical protein